LELISSMKLARSF